MGIGPHETLLRDVRRRWQWRSRPERVRAAASPAAQDTQTSPSAEESDGRYVGRSGHGRRRRYRFRGVLDLLQEVFRPAESFYKSSGDILPPDSASRGLEIHFSLGELKVRAGLSQTASVSL